ncbi:MAG: Ig-like domain-containing protein, partial [Bacilli bacterium]
MHRLKSNFRNVLALLFTIVLGTSVLAVGMLRSDANQIKGEQSSYTITMNSDNAPTSSAIYTNTEKTIRYSTFEYTGARTSGGSHVELKATGYLNNKADSQITSITSIQTNFTTSGTLTLATSFDGQNYTQTNITSGAINQTSTLPYHFRLTANTSSVIIQSVVITYSCEPHVDPIGEQSAYDITIKDYSCNNIGTDISGSINGSIGTYLTSDIVLSSVSGSKIFGNTTPTATNFKLGSSTATGNITFNFSSIKISQVIVSAFKYDSDTVSIKVTTSADSTGKTISIPATSATNYTYDLVDNNESTSLTLAGVGKRFHLEGLTIISAGSASGAPIETGFYAEDDNADNYTTSDVYATANAITATVAMTSGSSIPLNYSVNGVDGYNYVLKNASNEQISANSAFPMTGTYYVVISYRSYSPITIELSVSEAPQATLVSVSAVDSKTTYALGDIYDDDNQLVVTATYSDSSTVIISYEATGINGYTIYCLDPNADDFYTSNPFTVPGDYLLTVTYKGVESNDVEFSVQAESGQVTEATISILTNSDSDSTPVTSPLTYLSASGVTLSGASASSVFGGAGEAKFRFSSNSGSGNLTINLSTGVVITSVSLSVGRYNDTDTVGIKVATGANTTGQSLTLSSGVSTLSYTSFANDTQESASITISSPAKNRFFLYGINLGIGAQAPVSLTGVSLKSTTNIPLGGSETLTPTFTPSNATNKNVNWSTNNSSVASVNNGVVTTNAVGSAIITVTAEDGGFTAQCIVTVTAVQYNNYYKASTVDPNFNLQDLQQAGDVDAIPSPRTDLNILVIPIEFTDYTFTSKTLTDIQTLFNGTPEQTNYWESVSSFYEKSSYGNLDLTFTIANKFNTGYTALQAANLDTSSTQYFTTNLIRNAVSNYKSVNGSASTQQFDADNNGYIDAVWMIYSCPNYSNSNTIRNISTDYWAYVFWDYNQYSSTSSPNQNNYGWASYDFMYEGGGTTKVDAHTFIHETGHLLGLDDYYNYDDDSDYKPTGGIDMMDYNVTDHNVWSKMALGWTKPYVVTGNAEITINPAESSGDAILIADNWNGTSYDEFMMLELYTPTGLNQLDSLTAYNGSYPQGYTIPGVRLYHIDSRIGKFSYSSGWYFNGYYEPTSLYLSGDNYYGVSHSNTPSYSADPDYRLIHMIQAGGTNTFDTGSTGTNADLFTTGKTF